MVGMLDQSQKEKGNAADQSFFDWLVDFTALQHSYTKRKHTVSTIPLSVKNGDKKPLSSREQQEQNIRSSCPVLAPTGCTPQFCQSGRQNRPLEPRVGENHPLLTINNEAAAFLHEMYTAGLFDSVQEFNARLVEVMRQILSGRVNAKVWENTLVGGEITRNEVNGVSTRGWVQSKKELEWGIRFAWRNSRKCIMRAFFRELKLVDLRHVTTSQGMIDAMIEHTLVAFNGGRIIPTVFVFPPRAVDETGPMFWSEQLLTFAGYKLPNGDILGDPASVQLTQDIIDLGWTPPEPKSRWDILPLVAMAEGDKPAIGILPPELTELVSIQHPAYQDEFQKLDLKWYKFPALARLGFDIGGVQYTAAPFIGWWMDAEIGVRDLADTFRYNCLPDVIGAIGWKSNGVDFEDLPDHERLLWLSKAQAELNFAVHYSFEKSEVTCSSSLTASKSWCAFDDEHLQEKGYRLNADPYWISPPQGSIIPLWHRGGAPNYQPKPVIAKHRLSPVSVWKRRNEQLGVINGTSELQRNLPPTNPIQVPSVQEDLENSTACRVHVFYCGTAGTTLKLSERLWRMLHKKQNFPIRFGRCGTLNSLITTNLKANDILLIVAATTGVGEVPFNGRNFLKSLPSIIEGIRKTKFTIFGIGDTGYHSSFNGAAKTINQLLLESDATPFLRNSLFEGDVATEKPPLRAFESWSNAIKKCLNGEIDDSNHRIEDLYTKQYYMLQGFKEAAMNFDSADCKSGRMLKLSLDIKEPFYQDMGHIRLLPRNSTKTVDRIIELFSANDETDQIALPITGTEDQNSVHVREFLTDFVDLDEPFISLDWARTGCPVLREELNSKSVIQVVEEVFKATSHPSLELLREILLSMPLLRPRCYSVASSCHDNIRIERKTSKLDILVRIIPNGRFSDQYLSQVHTHDKARYKFTPNDPIEPLLNLDQEPLIVVACGSGFGPARSLIQHRLQINLEFKTHQLEKMSLFLGFRPHDCKIFTDTIDQAAPLNMFDAVFLVPSNEGKVRVQDHFEDFRESLRSKLVDRKGYVFVCGGPEMVKGVREKLECVLGSDAWESVCERMIQEIF